MGFGTGFDDPPRRQVIIDPDILSTRDPGAARLAPLKIFREMGEQVEVRTPYDAPPRVVLRALSDEALKTHHAAKLVRLASDRGPTRLYAERSLVGDARDLLCHVLEQHLEFGDGTLRCTNDVEGTTGGGFREDARVVIHIGDTSFAREVLARVIRGQGSRGPAETWDGSLDSLDGDGYAWLCVEEPDATLDRSKTPSRFVWAEELRSPLTVPLFVDATRVHLILAGGSPYGTHFGVARFLTQFLGAQWLFPGEAGEVIPLAGRNGVRIAEVNLIEEPTVRSRTFGGFTDGGGSAAPSAADKDAMRAWLLRNRIRPDFLRAEIFELLQNRKDPVTGLPSIDGLPMDSTCAMAPDPDHQAFFLAMLQSEERVSAGHSLTRHLSPFLPPTVVVREPGAVRVDADSMQAIYPDLRTRDVSRSSPPRLGIGLGDLHDAVTVTHVADTQACDGHPRNVPEPGQAEPWHAVLDVSNPASESAYASNVNTIHELDTWCGAILLDPARGATTVRRFLRFVPTTQLARLHGPMWPNANWHPCVFEDDGATHRGALFPVRAILTADIAAQADFEMAVRSFDGVLGRDAAHSIVQDDGARWCTCDACTHADEVGGANGYLSLYLGDVISRRRYNLEILVRTTPSSAPVPITSVDDLAPSALRGMSIDELCMRGVIHNRGYQPTHSRRVITLAQGVVRQILAQFDGDPLWGTAPDEMGRAHYVRHHVLSAMAYGEFSAAPMMLRPLAVGAAGAGERVPLTPTLGEQLPSPLLVFITESRDTAEFDIDYPPVAPGTIAGAARRMRRWPQQFNHERWAMTASRTGLYEYIQAQQFVVPRIYTRKLQRAVQYAVQRFGMSAFVSETRAAAGIMGPMLWELAQVLWDPSMILETLRDTWCVAAFGPASAAMVQYFSEAEDAWNATRCAEPDYATGGTKPDRRASSGNADGYFGQGFVGRVSRISQFAGLMRSSAVPGLRVYERLGRLLDDAARTPTLSAAEARRVQLFRRTFKFAEMIARWYQPLYDALEIIRQVNVTSPGRNRIENMGALDQMYIDVPPTSAGAMPILRGYEDIRRTGELPEAIQRGVRACLGDERVPGIFKLRRMVHLYLSRDDLRLLDDGNLVVSSAGDSGALLVGFGVLVTEVGAVDATFAGEVGSSDHRFAGLYWPDVIKYSAWWNSVRGSESLLVGALNTRLRRRPDDAGHLGWLFRELKQLAKAVVLYCPGFMDPSNGFSVTSVYNAIQGG